MFFFVHQPQIFKAVVFFVVVYMVYNLIVIQVPSNCSLHQHSMEHNITVPVCVWMFRNIRKNIPAIVLLCVSVTIKTIKVSGVFFAYLPPLFF